MQAIWKFPFEVRDVMRIDMPEGAKILSVQVQKDQPCMWALVDTSAPLKTQKFAIRGTGNPIEGWLGTFVGTFQLFDGDRVFHLFEMGGPR